MAQQRNAYSMALQASVAAEQPIVVREQQQFIDAEDEAVRIEPVAITSINVDVPTAAIGVFIGEEIEIAVDLVDCLVEFGSDRLSFVEGQRSEEHTSELQSLMRISYAVFCLKKKHYFSLYFFSFLLFFLSLYCIYYLFSYFTFIHLIFFLFFI